MSGGCPAPDVGPEPADTLTAWAASGLMMLTGRPDGPGLGPPPGLVPGVRRLATEIARRSGRLGRPVVVDPLAVMAERAVLGRMRRGGAVSCSRASRLVRAGDGWIGVSLARPSDWDLVAAWLGLDGPVGRSDWATVAAEAERHGVVGLLERSTLLGLPVARVGERRREAAAPGGSDGHVTGIRTRRLGAGAPAVPMTRLVVADLSALWAGPLVGALLRRAGAAVVKVESASRPDGARRGQPDHYRSLNGGKTSTVVEFGSSEGQRTLRSVVEGADVVITAARPRALEQLGLDPESTVRDHRPRIWLSISGYGSSAGSGGRVAFGDDAAAAGGLVVWDERGPCFCADAVADPVTGLAAASAVFTALEEGGDHLIEASMADVAGGLVQPTPAVDGSARLAPRPR
ncbi:MAG TPA: CoA transferase [Acidimicrobiales bacterium]